jgi:hypothetical protein
MPESFPIGARVFHLTVHLCEPAQEGAGAGFRTSVRGLGVRGCSRGPIQPIG